MTLIVGFNFGSYALFGADTRVCWYPNEELTFRDDQEKIRHTGIGLITGAGLVDLLDPVQQRLNDDEVNHTDTIVGFVNAQVEHVRRQPWSAHPRVKDSIEHTAWMFSYVTVDDPTNPTSESVRLRLAITVPHEGHKLAIIQENDMWLLAPTGTTEDQFWTWRRFCKDNMNPLTDATEFATNVAHHVGIIAQVMKKVADANQGVAETFQLGLHALPHLTGISSIVRPDADMTWDWGDAEQP